MFHFRKGALAFIAMTSLLAVSACSTTPEPAETSDPVTLRWGLVLNEDHAWYTCGIEKVQEILAENDEAKLDIEVFPGGQLGTNEEMVDSVSQGTLDMTIPGVGSVSGLYPDFGVLEAFFVFDDVDHGLEVWNGEIGAELKQGAIDEANVHVLGDLWYIGTRYVTANKKIETPADLVGLSMRAQDTPASFANISSLGANPTPINFGELYLALSQGVVDSQENPIPNIVAAKFQEVQDYLMLTAHVPQFGSVLISEDVWQGLSATQQQALDDAVRTAAANVRVCIEEQETTVLEEWQNSADPPIEVVEVDRDAFQEAALEYFTGPDGPAFSELYQRIRETS
ncbi:MAG: DctP family TRAP transporter solute-binding subunit [Pseudolysinimonas sp.]|uniref:DctP family TRAP transporter solute-binding subunit n=1 Tax=Pseudolysinimonas sp. TaxID=2680009 RepID=UPI003C71DD2C